jgi:hypothetical protein
MTKFVCFIEMDRQRFAVQSTVANSLTTWPLHPRGISFVVISSLELPRFWSETGKRATIFRNVQLLWLVSFFFRKVCLFVGIKSFYVLASSYD